MDFLDDFQVFFVDDFQELLLELLLHPPLIVKSLSASLCGLPDPVDATGISASDINACGFPSSGVSARISPTWTRATESNNFRIIFILAQCLSIGRQWMGSGQASMSVCAGFFYLEVT